MTAVIRLAAESVAANGSWMAWNLLLALIPLAVAVMLFLHPTRRTLGWWLGVGLFLAFLPNAPYVLTDVIHLVEDTRTTSSPAVVSFALLPQYAVFFLVGFEAYVLSLLLVGRYLQRVGLARWVLPVEVALHALCAIGVHLGRFERLNTWDVLTRPALIGRGIAGMNASLLVLAFLSIALGYLVMKHLTLAVLSYRSSRIHYG
ncbi:MAG: hypothetical protein QOE35_3428 [Actinomycetota bacterium]|jgi:uncharacterized membrane protein